MFSLTLVFNSMVPIYSSEWRKALTVNSESKQSCPITHRLDLTKNPNEEMLNLESSSQTNGPIGQLRAQLTINEPMNEWASWPPGLPPGLEMQNYFNLWLNIQPFTKRSMKSLFSCSTKRLRVFLVYKYLPKNPFW